VHSWQRNPDYGHPQQADDVYLTRKGEFIMSGKKQRYIRIMSLVTVSAALATVTAALAASDRPIGKTSYAPVDATTPFATVKQTMEKEKPAVMQRQLGLLAERYDLSDKPLAGVKMSRGKAVQDGVRVKLPKGVSWQQLAAMGPEQIRDKDLFPRGFLPLPHPNHPEGGMLFPKFHIDEIKKQTGRDLTRFDLDFDLPDHVLPEF
jgi:cytochrome c peroxidase